MKQSHFLSISKIIQLENSRGKHTERDLKDLMASIKQNGLLQPIGVRTKGKQFEVVYGNRRFEACKKLGYKNIWVTEVSVANQKEFLLLNLIENAQRSDVTVYEQGRIFHSLKEKEDMSESEIAVRVGVTPNRVRGNIAIFNDTPKEFRDKIVKMPTGNTSNRKGKIPVALAEKVIMGCKRRSLKAPVLKGLLSAVAKDQLRFENIEHALNMIESGKPLIEALEKTDQIKILKITIPVFKKDFDAWHDKWEGNFANEIKDTIYSAPGLGLKRPY